VPTVVGEAKVVPSGLSIDTFVLQQLDVPIVTPVSSSATRRPAEPSKETLPFCPGVAIVTLTGGPPGVVSAVTSGGTS
jgi:hypothetical protein